MTNQINRGSIDTNRRKFLTVLLVGSGAFLVEKILGPIFSFLSDPSSAKNSLLNNSGPRGGLKVVENKKGLSVYDDSGEEVFQIDKEV